MTAAVRVVSGRETATYAGNLESNVAQDFILNLRKLLNRCLCQINVHRGLLTDRGCLRCYHITKSESSIFIINIPHGYIDGISPAVRPARTTEVADTPPCRYQLIRISSLITHLNLARMYHKVRLPPALWFHHGVFCSMTQSEQSFSRVRSLVEQILRSELTGRDVTWSPNGGLNLTNIANLKLLTIAHKLVDSGLVVLHGSNSPCAFTELLPRQANDAAKQSGNHRAVYATVEVDAALTHAVFNKSYVQSRLDSFTFGYRITHGQKLFRATENLYRLFIEQDPQLCTDGFVYVLDKGQFTRAADAPMEYHSCEAHKPLFTLRVSQRLREYLFIVGRSTAGDTVVQYLPATRIAFTTTNEKCNSKDAIDWTADRWGLAHAGRARFPLGGPGGSEPSESLVQPKRAMTLDSYKPRQEWYLHNPSGIHGLGHAARVLVWANVVGCWMTAKGTPVDLDVVRWAAALHDIRRIDEGTDAPHGERAAHWVRGSRQKILYPLNQRQLERIGYCCAWHVPDDRLVPAMTPELVCLKDADGLDRVRLRDLNPTFLRTVCARALCNPAQALFDLSQHGATSDKWEAVRNAAMQLDLWSFKPLDDFGMRSQRIYCSCC
jgi:hypothetical protein